MARLGTLTITGKSKTEYDFDVFPQDTEWGDVAGVYAVTKRAKNSGGGWSHTYIYIGETDNMKKRHAKHHKAQCFKDNNSNCICVHREKSQENRLKIEADILAARAWPCND